MSVTNNIEENKTTALVNIFGRTDVGKSRDHNEDNFAIGQDISANQWEFNQHALKLGELGSVMVVADGMGGTNAGEVASEIMVNTAKQMFQQLQKLPDSSPDIKDFLKKVIRTAHKNILMHSVKHPETQGMGTTAVVAWVIEHKAYLAWAGDSRAYLYRKGVPLTPATDDHSMVWELVQSGHLTPNQARLHPQSNIITQSLGDNGNPPNPETKKLALQKGDRLMLCSDGLNGELDDPEIEAILEKTKGTPETCQELVNQANLAGGSDNITVLLMDVLDMHNESTPTSIRETADQKPGTLPTKNLVILGVSLLILVCSIYLFATNLHNKDDNTVKLNKAAISIKKTGLKPDPIPVDSTVQEKDSTAKVNQPEVVHGIKPPDEPKADPAEVAKLQARLGKLLEDKAKVLKNIEGLKKSYKDVPEDLNKLKALQQRLTNEIAKPLLAKKIIKGSNEFVKPTTKKAYEQTLYTIERVEANLYDIQEKMKYWQLNSGG